MQAVDEPAWARGFATGALLLAAASLALVLLGPALGVADPAGGGGLAFLSRFSAFEAMVVLFGPSLLVSLVGLASYARLDAEGRAQARIAAWAPAIIVGVPLAILILYVIALSTLGPV